MLNRPISLKKLKHCDEVESIRRIPAQMARAAAHADSERQYLERSLIKLINDYEDETGCEITNIEIVRQDMVGGKSVLASVGIAITIPRT